MFPEGDVDGDVGAPNVVVMEQIRKAFLRLDGLVDESESGFDDLVDPRELRVHLNDGIGSADWARFDVTWYQSGCYSVHRVDSEGVNFRWDCHPKDGAPERHFHPPPDAASDEAEPSCIDVTEPKTVARAVHKLWRRAYENESLSNLNDARNPP